MSFEHGDVGMPAYLVRERLLHGRPGGVGDVEDAPVAVAALTRQMVAGFAARKGHALVDQPFDRFSAMLDDEPRGRQITQPGAGGKGVLNVRFDRVCIIKYRRDAALRTSGG